MVLPSLAWNAVEATLVAVVVYVLCRSRRVSPPLRHTLWLLVVIKLIMPPLVQHPIGLSAWRTRGVNSITDWLRHEPADSQQALPSILPDETNRADAVSSSVDDSALAVEAGAIESELALAAEELSRLTVNIASQEVESARDPIATPAGGSGPASVLRDAGSILSTILSSVWFLRSLVGLWAAGAAALVITRIRQVITMRQLLRATDPAPKRLADLSRRIAHGMGLSWLPAVRVADAAVTPMVSVLGRVTIVLPAGLVGAGGFERVESVLAHELAHVRRRDHWVCWLEVATSIVYWWHPVFWWSRSELCRAADEAADAWAVAAVGSRRAYAESLLGTLEFLVADRAVANFGPALGERDTIARRLTMIMREPLRSRLSWPARLGMILLGLVVLPAAPLSSNAQDAASPINPAVTDTAASVGAPPDLVNEQQPPPERRPDPPRDGPADDAARARSRRPQPPHADAVNPRPPQPPFGRSDGPGQRDQERRLQELEAKLDRIMQMLESRPGQPGGPMPGMSPGAGAGPMSGFRRGGSEAGQPVQPGPGGAQPPGVPGMPGMNMGSGMRAPLSGFGGMGGASSGTMGTLRRSPARIEDMLRDIDLQPEQRERIANAHRELEVAGQQIQAEQARVMQEFERRRADIERRRIEVIREALTPEQRERFDQRRPDDRGRERGADPRPETGDGSGRRGFGGGFGSGSGRASERAGGGGAPRREAGPDRPAERGETGRDQPRDTEPPRGGDRDRPGGRDRESRPGTEPPRDRDQPRNPEAADGRANLSPEVFSFFVGFVR